MISSYGDQSTTRIILHIIVYQRAIALNASRDTLCSIHCNYNIRVTHRNGAIKHIFYTNQIHGGSSANCSLFILSLHALALHLAVKILLQIFLYEDLSTLTLHTSVDLFPQNASRTALCYATNTIK